jgi:hypothetical protein
MSSKIPLLDAADVRFEFVKFFFLPMTDITFEATSRCYTLRMICNYNQRLDLY